MSIQISECNGTVIENNDGNVHIKGRNITSLTVNGCKVKEEQGNYSYIKHGSLSFILRASLLIGTVLGFMLGVSIMMVFV